MNRNLHRLIFNKARGQVMVVGEVASAQGKAGSGQTTATVPRLRFIQSALACALGCTLGMPALAQIIADPSAPGNQRPTVLQTANGLPQVNIQTPSAAGVSRNTFSQFDVQPGGAILNNSRTNAQTQLGGWVQGNPWLTGGSARIILNEVNSTNPSQLRGYVEIAGPRTELIIANPAGININGAGFINASRLTLTTGTPVINNGNLDSYRVQAGTITINGQGLDLRDTDYTGILARALQVNAGIWAKELKIVTGANDIDASHSAITPITPNAGSGPTPVFALDVAQLGGMYAGKIFLIGTEAGLGVNNAGTVASSGPLTLQANGWLSNSGAIQAQDNAQLTTTGPMTNSGLISSKQQVQLSTPLALDNSGGTFNAQRLDLSANSLVNLKGVIEQTGLQALGIASTRLSNTTNGQIGDLPAPTVAGTGSASGTVSTAGTAAGSAVATTGGNGTTGLASGAASVVVVPTAALADG